MTERTPGYYWTRALGHPPEVALWAGDVWFFAGMEAGYVPEAVAVLSPRLAPPFVPAEPGPGPRVAVRWGVPAGEGGDGDGAGGPHGGGTG